MTPILAAFLVLQVPIEQPPRLRTILPNNAVILVENMPSERIVSVQLFASARATPETASTHGLRHLMEHLIAKGGSRDVDMKLESNAATLNARTYRDAMQIEITVPSSKLQLALDTLQDILKPLEASQKEIQREAAIMKHELAVQDDASSLGMAAWTKGYGEAGLDPLGNVETMEKASLSELRQLQRKTFYPENLALVIAGPVDLDKATAAGRKLLGGLQGALKVQREDRPKGTPGRVQTIGFGDARAAFVESFDAPSTAATLAAAFAVASEVPGSFVTYTPTTLRGLVIVGQSQSTSGTGVFIDSLDEGKMASLFNRGRALAQTWIARQLGNPTGVGYLRGMLLCQGPGYRPESMLQNLKEMTFVQFKEGFDRFSKERCVVSVGGG